MSGDDRVRHCAACDKQVYNFAAMTGAEAEALIRKHEGRLCGRLYRRADGTVLTADCPVGRGIVRRKAAWLVACAAAVLVLAVQAFAYLVPAAQRTRLREFEPFAAIAQRLSPQTAPAPLILMGDMSWTPANSAPAPAPANSAPASGNP